MGENDDKLNLVIPKDCNNAPRKQIVLDFILAVLMGQTASIQSYTIDSIQWHQINQNKVVNGQDELIEWVLNEKKHVIGLEIYQVITHGKFASVNGAITLSKGDYIEFCYVLTFSSAAKSAKIVDVKSYEI